MSMRLSGFLLTQKWNKQLIFKQNSAEQDLTLMLELHVRGHHSHSSHLKKFIIFIYFSLSIWTSDWWSFSCCFTSQHFTVQYDGGLHLLMEFSTKSTYHDLAIHKKFGEKVSLLPKAEWNFDGTMWELASTSSFVILVVSLYPCYPKIKS